MALSALLAAPALAGTPDPSRHHPNGSVQLAQLVFNGQRPRGYQEPAYARGYADGHARGLEDGRQRNRYDPAGSPEYRDGDGGYDSSYGSRDAYRDNYRAGFRQGYEDGYRQGAG